MNRYVKTETGLKWHPQSLLGENDIADIMNGRLFDDDPRAEKKQA